jgi:hypothetical protein
MDNFLSYRASVCLLARSSGASFRAGVSVPTDECVEYYCVLFACDVLFVGFVPFVSNLIGSRRAVPPRWGHVVLADHTGLRPRPGVCLVRYIYRPTDHNNTFLLHNTQEVTTHSAAPSKSIHSSNQKFNTDRTSTSKQNITSKHHTTLLHTFICRHPHASPEAGTTAPRNSDEYILLYYISTHYMVNTCRHLFDCRAVCLAFQGWCPELEHLGLRLQIPPTVPAD